MNTKATQAPELNISHWFNTDSPITLESLLGKVVVIEAFQMLCPGCVSHGLPQATRIAQTFSNEDVVVLGVHTVFEHHDAQGSEAALKAFLHEYRIAFPVGIDTPSSSGNIPQTMSAYKLQGTPSLILIDRQGLLRKQVFGAVTELALGAEIMQLVAETVPHSLSKQEDKLETDGCDEQGCQLD